MTVSILGAAGQLFSAKYSNPTPDGMRIERTFFNKNTRLFEISGLAGPYTNYRSESIDPTGVDFIDVPATSLFAGFRTEAIEYNGAYYAFANGAAEAAKQLYLWKSTDGKTGWAKINGGAPVINASTDPASPWYFIWNVGVAIINDVWHIVVESAPNGTNQAGVGLGYSYATLSGTTINFDANRSAAHVIPYGGNPVLVHVPERNAILCIHGNANDPGTPFSSPDYWYTTMSTVSLAADLSLAASWTARKNTFALGEDNIHICDPAFLSLNGDRDSQLLLHVSYNQNSSYFYQSDKTLLAFFDILTSSVNTPTLLSDPSTWLLDGGLQASSIGLEHGIQTSSLSTVAAPYNGGVGWYEANGNWVIGSNYATNSTTTEEGRLRAAKFGSVQNGTFRCKTKLNHATTTTNYAILAARVPYSPIGAPVGAGGGWGAALYNGAFVIFQMGAAIPQTTAFTITPGTIYGIELILNGTSITANLYDEAFTNVLKTLSHTSALNGSAGYVEYVVYNSIANDTEIGGIDTRLYADSGWMPLALGTNIKQLGFNRNKAGGAGYLQYQYAINNGGLSSSLYYDQLEKSANSFNIIDGVNSIRVKIIFATPWLQTEFSSLFSSPTVPEIPPVVIPPPVIVPAGIGYSLQEYITDAQRLLHDSTNRFWSEKELIDYVNKARKLVAVETACTRSVIPLDIMRATSLNEATYSLDEIGITRRVVDVLEVLLRYSTNTTYPLRFLPASTMVRTVLWQYQSQGTPTHYTILNRQLIILQWPGVDYLGSSVDCILEPANLLNLTDTDEDIAFPYTECVGFYVAYLAKLKDQRRQEANDFFGDYRMRVAQAIGSQQTRRLVGR